MKLLGSTESDHVGAIALDRDSRKVYLSGIVSGSVAGRDFHGATDGLVAKYDYDGANEWVRLVGTNEHDKFTAAAFDSTSKHLYVAGTHGRGSKGTFSVAQFDPRGNRNWLAHMPKSPQANGKEITDVAWNVAGRQLYVVGWSGDSGLIASVTESGNLEWIETLGAKDGNEVRFMGATSSGRSALAAGFTTGDIGNSSVEGGRDALFVEYGPNGTRKSVEILGTPEREYFVGIEEGSKEVSRVFAAGISAGSIGREENSGKKDGLLYRLR